MKRNKAAMKSPPGKKMKTSIDDLDEEKPKKSKLLVTDSYASESESDTSDNSDADANDSDENTSDNSDTDASDTNSDGDESHPVAQSRPNEDDADESGSSEAESEEEESDSEGKFTSLRKDLSEMSFEDLHKLEQMIGTKVFRQAMSSGKSAVDSPQAGAKRKFKRENKNRPMEMSSKRPVKIIPDSAKKSKKLIRDPRFDDLSGEYSEPFFNKAYSFLGDIKQREKETLQKKLKKESDPEKKQKLKELLQRMTQKEQVEQQKATQKEKERERNKQERELVKQGKTPFYLKKSEKKKLDLADKYRELSKSGKVDTYLSKKRKKTAAKDRKKLPSLPS